ncbi:MAG: hypothetical protein C4537_05125 [Acholeplasma sp.]|jgi:hypothetical protein|nr:MAG: hypothetical protein C4537_05125 [Acholeplasma sp.]
MRLSKQNTWLLINTGILLVIAVIFILANESIVPKEPKDFLFDRVIELRNETDVERALLSGGYAIVDYKVEAYAGDTFLGTVYNVKVKNGYTYSDDYEFGMIELWVAIDPAGDVHVQVVELIQSDWTVKGIQNYIYQYYQGLPYAEVGNIPEYDAADLTAGATATDSTGTIQEIIQKAIDIHYDLIVDDPLVTLYGEGYVISDDETFVPTALVVNREIVKNSSNVDIGYVYTLTGAGDYDNGQEVVTGHTITLKVAFDVDDQVIGVVIPEELYGHTAGSRLTKIQNYADLLIGKTVSEFAAALSNPGDLVSGVTYTKDLVDVLIEALVEEVN